MVGAQNISEHFAAIYQDLYYKHLLEFKNVNEQINNRIIPELESDLDKVTNSTVRAALRGDMETPQRGNVSKKNRLKKLN